ncbi:MAG: tetratricopeptide repeat protein [Gemmatimonas sp.]
MNIDWKEQNAEGLSLAAAQRWAEAADAFQRALAAVEADNHGVAVTSVARDDVRARLLLNAGQCYFHTGNFTESRTLVERSYALRVALYGEDSLLVARTRGDLAVILAASGHTDEALSLLERAVGAVERKRGSESAHLLPLLNNAARLLARSAPERARPYIARLKALLFAQQQVVNASLYPPTAVPSHSFASDVVAAGGDDHYLRNAVAQTVDLLRATPPANIALSDEAFRERLALRAEQQRALEAAVPETPEPSEAFEVADNYAEPTASADTPLKAPVEPVETADDLTEIRAEEIFPEPQDVASRAPHEDGDTFDATFDDTGDDTVDDTVFDLVEPPPPTLSTVPDAAPQTRANPLGFEVEYGIPDELQEPLVAPLGALPPEPPARPESGTSMKDTPSSAAAFDTAQSQRPARNGVRAVGGVRRGSAQLVAMNRLWLVAAGVAAFGGGVGAYFVYNYVRQLTR